MGNPLGSTTELARRFETIALDLPELSANLELVPPMGRKRELRQIGGISSGGTLVLKPGVFTFGAKKSGTGRLSDGSPDSQTFTLVVDKEMNVTIREVAATGTNHPADPRSPELLVNGQTVNESALVEHQVIDVGSAQFIVAIPRPRSVRSRRTPSVHGRGSRLDSVEPLAPWIAACIPDTVITGQFESDDGLSVDLVDVGDASEVEELIQARRKAHILPDEIAHRAIVGSALLWDRSVNHPLFGTSAVGLGHIPTIAEYPPEATHGDGIEIVNTGSGRLLGAGYGVPLSIDLNSGPISVVGPLSLRSSVMRQILLSLVVASSPADVRLAQFPSGSEFDFCRTLPHFSAVEAERTLAVTDGSQISAEVENNQTALEPDWAIQGADCFDELPDVSGMVVTLRSVEELTLQIGPSGPLIEGLTPIGMARSLVQELAISLGEHGLDQTSGYEERNEADD